MYESFFGLQESPFSIAPDPKYLYMSDRHKEALAHLLYGLEREGGFVLLTGEVGTGKTTICRKFLQNVPESTEVAFVLYPKLSARELLATICDEVAIEYPLQATIKVLIDRIYRHLLEAHAQGKHTALIIDEAQNLTSDVLEQLRLLTNLETDRKKLLQIILLGQPELNELLNRPELRQLSQRVTARYHLGPLSLEDMQNYISFRLSVAGCNRPLFNKAAIKKVHRVSKGIPRLANLICDRALLGAYAQNQAEIDSGIVGDAAREIGNQVVRRENQWWQHWSTKGIASGLVAAIIAITVLVAFAPPRQPASKLLSASPSNGQIERLETIDPLTPQESLSVDQQTENTDEIRGIPASEAVVPEPDELTKSLAEDNRVLDSKPKPQSDYQYAAFENYEFQADNMGLAFQKMFDLWSVANPPMSLSESRNCQWVREHGLACLQRNGNWRSLMHLNRPAVLSLLSPQGSRIAIAVTDIDDAQIVTFYLNGEQHQAPMDTIDRYWLGDYTLIWRLPPYRSPVISPGTIQDKDTWLTQQLDLLDVALNLEAEANLDRPLKERVKAFQRSVGILADGIAGTITLIMLNSWTQPDVPLLLAKDKNPLAIAAENQST